MACETREKIFVRNTIILATGTFLPKLASFITLPIYTACLTKAEYGTFDLVTILCSLLLPVATLQIQSAVFRFLLERRDNQTQVREIISELFVFVIPVSIIVLTIAYFILGKTLSPSLGISIVVYFFVDILLVVTRQIARGLLKNHIYSVSAVINSFLNMGLVVLFLLIWNKGFKGLMYSLIISTTVSFVYIFSALRLWRYIRGKWVRWESLKKIISYSWPMVPNSVSLWVMRFSDRAILAFFMGIEANAIYAVANKIPTLLQLAQNAFSMAWSESASLAVNDNDVSEYYSGMFRMSHRVFAGFAALLMAILPILFTALIKGDYDESYIHISILIIGMFFSNISIYLGGIYIAYMKTKSIGGTTILAAILNFCINIIFVQKIGILAATLSTAISYFFLMVYRMIAVQKFQRIRYDLAEIIITDTILIIMCALCSQRVQVIYFLNFIIGCMLCIILNRNLIKKACMIVLGWLRKGTE